MTIDKIRAKLAELRADQLISELSIAGPGDIDIEAISMTQGALVMEGGIEGAEARLARSPKLSFIRVNNRIREPGRRRFAIAHELGHLLLQQGQSQFSLCTDRDLLPFYANSAEELEASIFAAALLMPGKLFAPPSRTAVPSLKHIANLAGEFQVTLTAAATRYMEFCPHRCCLVVSTAGKVRYHRPSTDFGYFIAPQEELGAATYAADYFEGKPLPKGMRPVKATAWLEGPRIDAAKTIMEDSVSMPSYNSVLTLLWIERDIDRYVSGEEEYDQEERDSESRWSWNRYRDRE